jgi:hypothetical protein
MRRTWVNDWLLRNLDDPAGTGARALAGDLTAARSYGGGGGGGALPTSIVAGPGITSLDEARADPRAGDWVEIEVVGVPSFARPGTFSTFFYREESGKLRLTSVGERLRYVGSRGLFEARGHVRSGMAKLVGENTAASRARDAELEQARREDEAQFARALHARKPAPAPPTPMRTEPLHNPIWVKVLKSHMGHDRSGVRRALPAGEYIQVERDEAFRRVRQPEPQIELAPEYRPEADEASAPKKATR